MNNLGFDIEKYLEELTIEEPKGKGFALKHMGIKTKRLKEKELQRYNKNRQLYYLFYSRRCKGDN